MDISKSKQPNLHDLFLDLSQTKFDFLDVEKDINETERELLQQFGVLVETKNIPEKPLFSCLLDEVEAADYKGDTSALIVNPRFRYEPFNFANFSFWIHEKHFSPYNPSVWLRQSVTDIEIGYWLNNQQAETISKFTAGEKLPVSIEPELLAKLVAAEILTTPEILAESEQKQNELFEKAKFKYTQDKYVILNELLPSVQMEAMRRYYRQYVSHGFMPFDDTQSKRYYQHNEPLAKYFHTNLAKLMSIIIGEEVIPSYVYAASYIDNADLKPHTDRSQCEFSISFQIDYLPEPEDHLSPWGLFLQSLDEVSEYTSEKFPAESQAADENTAVYLKSGDGLIYKGRELIHYRYPLTEEHQSTSLFFHYVPKNFDGNLS